MKLEEFPLIIPNIKKVETKFKELLAGFYAATSAQEQKK